MRRSGWLLPITAVALFIASVGWPALAALGVLLFDTGGSASAAAPIRSPRELLLTSLGWSLAVAGGAVIVGWAPGRLLGRALQRKGFVPLAILMLAPICLPAYIVFFAWWQSWSAETAVYRWVVEHHHMQLARHATLWLGMTCWSWPLVSWCVAGVVAATSPRREELLQIDGAGPLTRFVDRLRCDARGLTLGGLAVFIATFGNTTCFDLAEVFTFANELRAVRAVGATNGQVLTTAIPAMLIMGMGAISVWLMLGVRTGEAAERHARVGRSSALVTAVIWAVSVLVPLGLFAGNVLSQHRGLGAFGEFFDFYGFGLASTVTLALASGCLGAAIAVGCSALWQDDRRWTRWVAHVMAVGWLIAAVTPGTIIGVALEAAYNRSALQDLVYLNPTILVIAHLSTFGFIGALLGRWLSAAEPATMRDLRRLDGAQTLPGIVATTWPRLLAAATATLAVVFVLAIGEIPVTAQVVPPMRVGRTPLSLTLLNDMHYQRPQTVMVAAILMMLGALVAAGALAGAWSLVRRAARGAVAAGAGAVMLVALVGCVPDDPEDVPPLDTSSTFGSPGLNLGQFNYPRTIDVDLQRQVVYVVDKTARVQRFGFDGKPQLQWQMPEWENGKPTGVTVGPDGTVYVADTHYFRVIAYTPEGQELFRFGEYGREPGQFIYTTDVAIGPQGRLYASEYGGNDRVQVFSPTGDYLFQFGSFGPELGQFNRPQAMVFNEDQTELFIADACNHRIVVMDPKGTVLRSFGSAGRAFGQLMYPYGIMRLDDGSLMVAEFGNSRVQRFGADGEPLGLFGRYGREMGELLCPWSIAGDDDRLFVLDSQNNRVQVWER